MGEDKTGALGSIKHPSATTRSRTYSTLSILKPLEEQEMGGMFCRGYQLPPFPHVLVALWLSFILQTNAAILEAYVSDRWPAAWVLCCLHATFISTK